MRIAFNFKTLGAAILALSAMYGVPAAYASELPPMPSSATGSALPTSAMPKTSTTAAMNMLPAPSIAPPMGMSGVPSGGMGNMGSGLTSAENKIPDSVKDVLKRLDKPTEDVTLDDLNSGRQAVAKIEILIDIEKHLAELDKIRHERQKTSMPTMANMIPASALQPPAYTPPANQNAPAPMLNTVHEATDVTQISGGGGHYSATLKMAGDEARIVHVGDHLSDGSSVVEISALEVVLDRNGTKRTLHVKNVNTVFGNSF